MSYIEQDPVRRVETRQIWGPLVLGKMYRLNRYASTYQVNLAPNPYPTSYDVCVGVSNAGPPYRSGSGVFIGHTHDGRYDLKNVGIYDSPIFGYQYRGGFMCSGYRLSTLSSITDMHNIGTSDWSGAAYAAAERYGAEAYARYAPGKAHADVAQFIAELKDVPRMLRSTAKWFLEGYRSFSSKRLADQWLNTQFGWLPFLSDLRRFHAAWKKADRMIEHIRRYNSVWRRYGGPVLSESEGGLLLERDYTAHSPILPTYFYSGSPSSTGSHTVSFNHKRDVWFTGQFRFYIPEIRINSVKWETQTRMNLLGVRLTPALVWELTPFSWLIDWFSNVSDVLENLDSNWAENLVNRMSFVMCHTRREWTVDSYHAIPGSPSASWSFFYETKTRAVANPFGFGAYGDLTPRQMSILAALGVSKS